MEDRYGSGMGMGVTFGSMVQKGKFLASAIDFCARALKSVDLPTLGSPTSPTRIFIERRVEVRWLLCLAFVPIYVWNGWLGMKERAEMVGSTYKRETNKRHENVFIFR